MIPYIINVNNLEKSKSIEFHIRKRITKLSAQHEKIHQCHIAIHKENSHSGKLFTIRLSLQMPGKKDIIVKKHDENIYVGIYAAFDAVERIIDKYEEKNNKKYRHVGHYWQRLLPALC